MKKEWLPYISSFVICIIVVTSFQSGLIVLNTKGDYWLRGDDGSTLVLHVDGSRFCLESVVNDSWKLDAPQDMVIKDGVLFYVSLYDDALSAVELSDSGLPCFVGSLDVCDSEEGRLGFHALCIYGDTVFIPCYFKNRVYAVDVSDPRDMRVLSCFENNEFMRKPMFADVALVDGSPVLVVTTYDSDGFVLLDVSVPSHIKILSYVKDIISSPWHPLIHDGYLYISSLDDGVSVFSLADIQHPVKVDCLSGMEYGFLRVHDGLLYGASSRTGELLVWDVSDPLNIHEVSRTSLGLGGSCAFCFTDDYRFVIAELGNQSGVKVIDVSDANHIIDTGVSVSGVGSPLYLNCSHNVIMYGSLVVVITHFDRSICFFRLRYQGGVPVRFEHVLSKTYSRSISGVVENKVFDIQGEWRDS